MTDHSAVLLDCQTRRFPNLREAKMQVPKMGGAALLLVASVMLTACAVGTDFVRPPADAIELGKTTYKQVEERFGKPKDETRVQHNKELLRAVSYSYANDFDSPKVPNTMAMRQLILLFSGDIVVMESFNSSFAADSTDFDQHKVGDIIKAKTRCSEVVQLLGRPSGRAIFPAVDKQGESAMSYEFSYVKRPLLKFKTYQKGLKVMCDSEGVVSDVSYTEAGDP